MRLYLSISCLLLSISAQANNVQQSLHRTFRELSANIIDMQQTYQNQHSTLINGVDYHYIKNIGGVFVIDYTLPLNQWFTNSALSSNGIITDTANSAQNNTQNNAQNKQAKDEFTQLRVQAKHLSHQIYSIERKLTSLNNSLASTEDRATLEKMISDNQAQLKQLKVQKQQLKPRYEQAQKAVQQTNNSNNGSLKYQQDFEQLLFRQVCQNNTLLSAVTKQANESLSFVLKHAGEQSEFGYQDIVYQLSANLLAACTDQALEEKDFINQLNNQRF